MFLPRELLASNSSLPLCLSICLSVCLSVCLPAAAGVFFDVLRQFGEPDEETSRRRVYCKWKASQILKAIKEGRTPTPGGAGEDVSLRGARRG